VTLRYGEREVEVDVSDDGRGIAPPGGVNGLPGHGLVGMRERVGLLGGELEAGRCPGGYRVAARLPA
jgi:signal transduction histidine kinase